MIKKEMWFFLLWIIGITCQVFAQDTLVFLQETSHPEEAYQVVSLYQDSTFSFYCDQVCYMGRQGKGKYRVFSDDSIVFEFPIVESFGSIKIDSFPNQDQHVNLSIKVMNLDSVQIQADQTHFFYYSNRMQNRSVVNQQNVSIKNRKIGTEYDQVFIGYPNLSVVKKGYYSIRKDLCIYPQYDYLISVYLYETLKFYENSRWAPDTFYDGSSYKWIVNEIMKGVLTNNKTQLIIDGEKYQLQK